MGEDAIITWDGDYYPHADVVADWDMADTYEIVARVPLTNGEVLELEHHDVARVMVAQGDKPPRPEDFAYSLGGNEGQAAWRDYMRPPGPGWRCPDCGHGRRCK